ncbi:T9SS type A sorting domain-containing protein [bacterium]|nr:T9SS type A sorting domain-containing protein [bacterium]
MKRYILLILLVLVGFSSIALAHSDRKEAERRGDFPDQKLINIELFNDYIKVVADDVDGQFVIGTTDERRLLYGFPYSPWSSHTQVLIDSDTCAFGNHGEIAGLATGTITDPLHLDGDELTMTWSYADVDVIQTLSIVTGPSTGLPDNILIQYTIINNSSTTKSVGVLLEMDTMIDYNDAAPISTSFGYTGVEQDFEYPYIPQYWQAFQSSPTQPESLLVGQGTLTGGYAVTPDRFCLGPWGDYDDVRWSYTSYGNTYGDSGVLLWWNPVRIYPGGTHIVATMYGVGAGNFVTGDLALNVTAPLTLQPIETGGYSPNPFEINVLVTNTTSSTINGVTATINLPTGLSLASGETATQNISPADLDGGSTGSVSWLVEADIQSVEAELHYTVSVEGGGYSNEAERYIIIPEGGTIPSGIQDVDFTIIMVDESNFPIIQAQCRIVDPITNPFVSLTGLNASNFDIYEDGTSISDFEVTFNSVEVDSKSDDSISGPIDLALVVDVSGDIGEFSEIQDNLLGMVPLMIDSLEIDLEVCLITFTDQIEQLYDFTSSTDEILGWTETAIFPHPNTPTVSNGLEAISRTFDFYWREGSTRLLTYFSNRPFDTGSGYTVLEVAQGMVERDIHGVIFGVENDDMQMLADSCRGSFINIALLDQIIDSSGIDFGGGTVGEYSITYLSPNPEPTGDWREIYGVVTVEDTLSDDDYNGYYPPGFSGFYFDPETTYTRQDYDFEVKVRVSAMVNLYDVHFIVRYDPAKLSYNSISAGEYLARNADDPLQVVTNGSGYIDISLTRNGSTTGVSGSGTIASLFFTATALDPTSDIYFDEVVVRDPDYADVFTVVDTFGYIRYLSGPRGSGTPGDTTDCILCDFDCDGDIDIRDFALLGTYWQPVDAGEGDVGPATGAAPIITPNPDGHVNFEDLFIFGRMWNWYHITVLGMPRIEIPEGKLTLTEKGDKLFILGQNLPPVAMSHLVLRYDPALTRVTALKLEDLPQGFTSAQNGLIEIAAIKLAGNGENAEIMGEANLLEISYQGINTFQIVEADFRNGYGELQKVTFDNTSIPNQFDLSQITPNPFNPTANFTVIMPEEARLKVEVFDFNGHKISTIVDQDFPMGSHTLSWEGSSSASGIYYIKATYENQTRVRKALLLK